MHCFAAGFRDPVTDHESTFDEWLTEQGLSDQGSAAGLKREISGRILERMHDQSITPEALAERMQTSRAAVARLLDPENDAVSLRSLYRAAKALNCRLSCDLR